jgi:hypothetical protein
LQNKLGICWSNVSIVDCYINDLETRTIKKIQYELEQPNIQFELELSQIQYELEPPK